MERQTIIEEIRFHINTKTYCHFCLVVQVSVILCRNQICFLRINICEAPREVSLLILTSHFVMDAE